MKATAAVVRSAGADFTIEEIELAEPDSHEVLVRIVGTGLCHTDLVARDQIAPFPLPCVLGHEGAGVVERVGPAVTKVAPGDHVVLSFSSCGRCENCVAGHPAYCKEFVLRNFAGMRSAGTALTDTAGAAVTGKFFGQSSFASMALADERSVVKVPKDVPLDILGPLGCGIQTGAGAVLNVLDPAPGSSLVVFGAGSVGLAALLAARVAGCTSIIAVDIKAERLELARELGATHVIDGGKLDAVAEIQRLTEGGANYSVDCTGVPMVIKQAVDALAPMGTCVMLGVPSVAEISLNTMSLSNGRTVRGVIEGDSDPDVFIPHLIQLWRDGRFPFDRLIRFYALHDINQAVCDSEHGGVIKPVLRAN